MGLLTAIALLASLLFISCDSTRIALHGLQGPKRVKQGQDLLLMADERQAVHYRYLAAEQVGAASRQAEAGNEAATAELLYGAIEYQNIVEEVEGRAAHRRDAEIETRSE